MRPVVTDNTEKFLGLGGVENISKKKWEFPVGIKGAHSSITFQEIDGSMPGLTAREDLRRWGADYRFSDSQLDLAHLDRWGLGVGADGEHTVLNFMDFDEQTVATDQLFEAYRSPTSAFLTTSVRTMPPPTVMKAWISQLGIERGVPKKNQRKEISFFGTMRDHGATFLWEFFAGHAQLTMEAADSGHIAFAPTDLRFGMDLSCPVHQKVVLELLDRHRPWMATFAFHCRGGSRAQALVQ